MQSQVFVYCTASFAHIVTMHQLARIRLGKRYQTAEPKTNSSPSCREMGLSQKMTSRYDADSFPIRLSLLEPAALASEPLLTIIIIIIGIASPWPHRHFRRHGKSLTRTSSRESIDFCRHCPRCARDTTRKPQIAPKVAPRRPRAPRNDKRVLIRLQKDSTFFDKGLQIQLAIRDRLHLQLADILNIKPTNTGFALLPRLRIRLALSLLLTGDWNPHNRPSIQT